MTLYEVRRAAMIHTLRSSLQCTYSKGISRVHKYFLCNFYDTINQIKIQAKYTGSWSKAQKKPKYEKNVQHS